MSKTLNFSVYVSTFDSQKSSIKQLAKKDSTVFASFHIQEEMTDDYKEKALDMVRWLKNNHLRIIGDISPYTLKIFGCKTIAEAKALLQLDALRLDYGFSETDIQALSDETLLIFNASTENVNQLIKHYPHKKLRAMHNFYPRPESGLDTKLFNTINAQYQTSHIPLYAFIPGDKIFRGPLEKGLPTLEKHRGLSPYIAYLDLAINHDIDKIFVGDIALKDETFALINQYLQTGVIGIPAILYHETQYYDQVFTIRNDSPTPLKRLAESREFSKPGRSIEPNNTIARQRGSITIDNKRYLRYSGEVQITAKDYPADEKVNVIGHVHPDYEAILSCLTKGQLIRLIKVNEE